MFLQQQYSKCWQNFIFFLRISCIYVNKISVCSWLNKKNLCNVNTFKFNIRLGVLIDVSLNVFCYGVRLICHACFVVSLTYSADVVEQFFTKLQQSYSNAYTPTPITDEWYLFHTITPSNWELPIQEILSDNFILLISFFGCQN